MKIPSFALVTAMLMITSLAFAQVPSKPGANLLQYISRAR